MDSKNWDKTKGYPGIRSTTEQEAHDINTYYESSILLMAFEENLVNIMQIVKETKRGQHADHVEEAVMRRYLDAKTLLEKVSERIEVFRTMIEIIEYDLLESTRKTDTPAS